MPVNYPDVLQQIKIMNQNQPAVERERSRRLDESRQVLHRYANSLDELKDKVDSALQHYSRLRTARPVSEPLDYRYGPPPAPQKPATVLAADGSQISPSRHQRIYFGLVNTGVFRMSPTPDQIPEEHIWSELLYPDPFDPTEELLTEESVARRRDLYERRWLARLIPEQPAPVIALTDGPLELHRDLLDNPRSERELQDYLRLLEPLVDQPVSPAGFVERPRSDLVMRLLELAEADPRVNPEEQRCFSGLTDMHLFSTLLGPGQRSAIFTIKTPAAAFFEASAGGALSLNFFYINVGSARCMSIARVELHAWAADQPWLVNLLHSTLLEQCACLGERPYPYALIRAHEVALVRMQEREQIENWIISGEMEAFRADGSQRYDYSQTSKQLNKDDVGVRSPRNRRW